jgi:cupin 2 domain-containing protein
MTANIFDGLPENLSEEVFEDIIRAPNVRIERIVSRGHASPEVGWYDQEENEWVILFEDGRQFVLKKGDYLNIPAHLKHRVLWTDKQDFTIWLAVFYA